MNFDVDVDDEFDLNEELGYAPEPSEDEFSDEYDDSTLFEDIDFEALGIDPLKPTMAKPGSQEKVLTLAARYAAGVPLWHDEDCYDHSAARQLLNLRARM